MPEPPSNDTAFVDSSSDVADSLFGSDAEIGAPTNAGKVNDTTDVIAIFDSDDEPTPACTEATSDAPETSDLSEEEEEPKEEPKEPSPGQGALESCEPLPMAISKIKKSIVHDMTMPIRVFIWSSSADVVADPRIQPDGSICLFLRDWRNAFKQCGIDLDNIGNIARSSGSMQWLSMALANYCRGVSKPNMILFISKEDIIVDLDKFLTGMPPVTVTATAVDLTGELWQRPSISRPSSSTLGGSTGTVRLRDGRNGLRDGSTGDERPRMSQGHFQAGL
ncbi:hypothetical protein C8F01DRAFT_1275225 [Mycena amicta]|nr:hypothetical protein C8F01DRAFT_1275225 [Mycena amicta]